jgi:hypothetical protein
MAHAYATAAVHSFCYRTPRLLLLLVSVSAAGEAFATSAAGHHSCCFTSTQ